MAKYDPKSVVHIKREIKTLSEKVSGLLKQKKGIEDEIPVVEGVLAAKRGSLRTFEDSAALRIKSLQQEESDLNESIEFLKPTLRRLAAALDNVRKAVASVQVASPDFSFVEQTIRTLSTRLNDLLAANDVKAKENAELQQKRNSLEAEVIALRDEKGGLVTQALELRKAILAGNDKNGKLGIRYIELQGQIEEIERRERDSRVMQKRLTPEYQKVYAETQT